MMPFNSDSRSERFTVRLYHLVLPHIPDSTLTVNKLCQIFGMSRTDLHRKLIRHTGLSASAFMRHVRIQQAKNLLLEQKNLPIREIGYTVGFNSPSYFSRVFKAVERQSPEAFRKKHMNLEHM